MAPDVFESYSAGTEIKPKINQDAVKIMKEIYGIDMEQTQYSKLITDIPNPDVAISMGCNVACPFVGRPFDDNWGLEDPTGKRHKNTPRISPRGVFVISFIPKSHIFLLCLLFRRGIFP